MPFVSIIITFNKGKRYLEDCFASLKEQNLEDTEVILVVNGCEENLDDLVNDFPNLIIKTFDEELGVAKARNVGLSEASGEYVYFIDSDDYLYSNALDTLVDVAHKTGADFVNGERVSTDYVRERFEEDLENKEPLLKNDLTDFEFSYRLLVGTKTLREEVLSVLHALIKREKLEGIMFDEDKRYNSDYYFIVDALENLNKFVGVENALYAKRSRDDPINFPSLNQEPKDKPFLNYANDYLNIYRSIESYEEEKYSLLRYRMAYKLYKFFYKKFNKNFLFSQDKEWRKSYFDAMADVSQTFDIIDMKYIRRKQINLLQAKDKAGFTKLVKRQSDFKKFKRMFSSRHRFKMAIYNRIFNKRPVNENQFMFTSFRGNFYSDSPKYIYEYLYNNYGDKFDYVWVINDKSTKIPGNPKKVKRFSLEYYREIARSKYWVINGRQPARLFKRPEQLIISTWHGTPLKKLGLDMGNFYGRNAKLKKSYVNVSKKWDYFLAPNHYTAEILKRAFAYEGDVLETGYPRNDILYTADVEKVNQIKENLNLPNDKKIILYAPTFRDDSFYDETGKIYQLNFELELDKMKEALSDEYILILRTHYFIADKLDLTGYEGFAFDASKYDDIAELYIIADILITDYSSVFFDYANLKKPILFYTYDIEKYENQLRGFYIDIHSEVPGPLLKTTDEVVNSILNIESVKEEYGEKYDEFYERFCSIDDGNASKRIVDIVLNDRK